MGDSVWVIATEPVVVPAGRVEALTEAVRAQAEGLVEDGLDIGQLDRFGVDALFSQAGYEVLINDDGGFGVHGYLDLPVSPEVLLPLLAAHAEPVRADWTMAGSDGLVSVERFEDGTYVWHEGYVVSRVCLVAVARAYQAITTTTDRAATADVLHQAATDLAEALVELGITDTDTFLAWAVANFEGGSS